MEPYDTDFDEILEELHELMKRMRMQELGGLGEAIRSGELDGNWSVKEIDEPGVKGYAVQGRFWTKPLETPDPFGPLESLKRRPIPQRSSLFSDNSPERREPLTDVFEEEKTIRVYVELPGEEKDDIKLNIVGDKVEVKAVKFYKLIDLPTGSIEAEKVSSRYNNGVLEVTIPKKEASSENEIHKIKIE